MLLSGSFRRRKPYLSYLLPAQLAFRQIRNPGMKKALCYIIICVLIAKGFISIVLIQLSCES